MKRRRAIIALLAAAAVSPRCAWSQPREKVHRIGVLLATNRKRRNIERLLVPFDQTLRAHGYIEGKNLIIEWREADSRLERYPALAEELVAAKVELIVAGAGHAAVAVRKATKSIPIVFVAAGDPVGMGLVDSLRRPGGNATGFSTVSPATTDKSLELLREVVPSLNRLAVLHTPGDATSMTQVEAMRHVTAALGLQVMMYDVVREADLEGVFRAIERARPDGLQVVFTPVTYSHRKRIIDFAAAKRIAAVYGYVEFVEDGGLMSYGFSYADNWRRTADYVARILKGHKPADLPVQQVMTFELAVNKQAAQTIGIAIPQSILVRADQVIE